MRRAQRGAALLVAMVLVTLVSTLAAGMVWQQWRAVEVEAAERARAQSAWILSGALDWARLILREDARTGGADHLGEPWAVPLAEARLSSFLAADRNNNATEDGPEAFLSGAIADAQSRYNLRNLLNDEGAIDPKQAQVLQKLLAAAGLSPELATQIATGLRDAWAAQPADQAPLAPRSVEELGWLGLDEAARTRLAPWVVLLPAKTPVNLNTAPPPVLAAVIEGLDLGGAQRLVQARERQPFQSIPAAQQLLPSNPPLNFGGTDVKSNYFEVRGRLRLGDGMLEERSLVERREREVIAIRRERVTSVLAR